MTRRSLFAALFLFLLLLRGHAVVFSNERDEVTRLLLQYIYIGCIHVTMEGDARRDLFIVLIFVRMRGRLYAAIYFCYL